MDSGVDEGEPEPYRSGSALSSVHPQVLAALSYLDLSDRVSFEDTKVVGAGAFGDVSKAQCTLPGRATTLVAIKRLRFHMENDLKSLFEKEIYVWAKLTHVNVLPLLGYVLDSSGYPLLVSEWMDNGSAWDYALNNVKCDLLKLVAGISEGLMYIHQMDVIHSDIKPANIVVSASGEARICDFGSSRMITTAASRSLANPNTKIQGTPQYLSYELVAVPNQGHSKGSDVWAFGMTIFALLAHQHPYAQIPKEHVSAVIASRKLPAFPSSEPSWTSSRQEARDIFWSICQLCWDHNHSTRADMMLITSILRELRTHGSIFRANQLSEEGALYKYLRDLQVILESISKAIDDVSTIHQNLKSVLEALSKFEKNIPKYSKADKKVVDLFRNILEAFKFAEDGSTLRCNLRLLEEPIIHILQKTKSSFDLLSEHTTSGRLLDTFENEKLNELIYNLLEWRKACDLALSCHNAVVRDRESEDINIKLLRELLTPNESYEYDSPTCLENTRVEVRREIINWVNAKTSPNVLWLHGVAGSGKSTVSRTIAEYFRGISQLGTFIFFERGKSDPSSVIPTIAFKLAKFDSSIGARIVDQVKKDKDILSAKPALQFSNLLLQPISASSTSMREPVLIILDALDECGVSQKRQDLIQVLRNELPKLPLSFRILITSRQETDIVKALSLDPTTVSSIELDCTSATSQSDVLRYIRIEMRNLVTNGMAVPKDWPWDVNMVFLGKAASGLFIWAATAVRLVANSDNPFDTLEGLISDTRSLNRFGLNDLYATVLRGSGISWESETSKSRFSRVLGLVIFGKAPFTIDTMDAFLGFSRISSSRLVLIKIRSLISFSTSTPVRLFHVSLADYLSSPERSQDMDPWTIDISNERAFHIIQCFTIMKRELHFNICDLPISFLPNDAVPGLPDLVRERISSHLGYACRFWAQHLRDVPFSDDMLKHLTTFTYERLLYWFEVLSLTKSFYDQAVQALRDANEWTGDKESQLSTFLGQAIKLASTYAIPISESTPHIYVSMLPLAEQDSVISSCYAKLASSLVTVDRRGAKYRTSLLKQFEHTFLVTSVGFSPDGKRVVSGSHDNMVRVWEVESGNLVANLFQGHTEGVTSVGFSPNGKYVVSGSNDNTVRVWEVEGGNLFTGPLQGHTDRVTSVGFSPDGKYVVSGSWDKTVCVWAVESGNLVAGPFQGHIEGVLSVSFSPDGKRVVSGSYDKTVRVWGVENGDLVAGPFQGHIKGVLSVSFSPDGKRAVSGSWDKTICVWEVESGNLVAGPFQGHTGSVKSVRFSPDGKLVVSGSADKTICMWGVESGNLVTDPLKGHTSDVNSVEFSLDGLRVVSGSDDSTVRVWEVESNSTIASSFQGHAWVVTSVGLSPDGKRVVSGSVDNMVCVWEVESGNLVAGPFRGHTDRITSVEFSPDGLRVVSGSHDYSVRVWEVESGDPIAGPFQGHTFVVTSVRFSPDGKRVVSGSSDNTIRVWEVESGSLIAGPFKGHSWVVTSVEFSPDGKRVVSGSWDKTICVWEVESGTLVAGPFQGHTFIVTTVGFSPDGKRVVSGSWDKTVRVWEVERGNLVAGPFQGDADSVTFVRFSPDGKRVVSGSYDNTVRVWEVETGEQLSCTFDIPSITSKLSQDGERIVSVFPDGSIRVSDLDTVDSLVSSPGEFSNWAMSEDNWIRSKEGKLLLWVPPDMRPTLWHARNVALFNCRFSTRPDFMNCALGRKWYN